MNRIKMKEDIKVSVIIPTRNRREVLQRVLEGLRRQDFDGFEVIIIDDGSEDGTFEWLQAFVSSSPARRRVLKTVGAGAGAARNLGAAQARGDVLLFLDADTIPGSDLVHRHWLIHQQFSAKDVCILGKIVMSTELRKLEQIRWCELDLPGTAEGMMPIDYLKYRTANSSLPRDLFKAVGGFHPGLIASEDLEFAFRLAEKGVQFYYYDDVVAMHHHPLNLAQYIEKSKTYGKAVAYWYRMSPELHPKIALRFGLYHSSLSPKTKLRYLLKLLVINGFTIAVITLLAGWLRKKRFALSDRLYRAVFGYYLRKEFRVSFHTALCVLGLYC